MSLDEILVRQDGVLSLAQAVTAGTSAETVRRWVARGRWTRLYPGVYLAGGHRLTDEARVRAAWLHAGPHALVRSVAAAYWYGMVRAAPSTVEISVPPAAGLRSRPGLRVRRRATPVEDTCRVRGVTLTGRARTVLDTAINLPQGSAFLDRALQTHVGFDELHRSYCRMLGTPGAARIGVLLMAAADGAASAAERLLVAALTQAGIGGWVLGHMVGDLEVDLAFPAQHVAIEVDGWAFHSDVERFRADRRKGNALVRAGWVLLRFTWHDLSGAPLRVVAEIRAALTSATRR